MSEYHMGYEAVKGYQAELRLVRGQDRDARAARAARPAGWRGHLAVLRRRLPRGWWAPVPGLEPGEVEIAH